MTRRMKMDTVTLPARRAAGKYDNHPRGNGGQRGARSRSDIDKPGRAALNGARHQLVAGDEPFPAQADRPRTVSRRDLKDAPSNI